MITRWDLGDDVRVIRNVRNDGTYPGAELGALLIRCGSTGTVIDVGTFLMDQIIYTVHFLDIDRIVGCREEELIDAEEAWTPSRFEFREKVRSRQGLSVGGQVLANASGRYGTTRDYVEQTISALRSHAMPDRNLEARLKRCVLAKP